MFKPTEDYKKQLDELLGHYVDGRSVFIKNDWEDALQLKPSAPSSATDNWMDLMEKVTGIIARSKYGLETYPNAIHILDSEQMLDVYVNTGMPYNYDHWSYGKERANMSAAHETGNMHLAYEMVINSDPSISYCMTSNSKTIQALVIAHAAQGHNAFFKNNTMFKQFTNASEILGDLKRFADFVRDCEVKYGINRVEKILDACHALKWHATDYVSRPTVKASAKQKEAKKAAIELARSTNFDTVIDTTSLHQSLPPPFRSLSEEERDRPLNEQNLLRYIGIAAPHLEDWERRIIGMFCDRQQYFYPQIRTKVMNEGFASFWHYRIMHDLHREKLIDDSMLLEFLESHTSVLRQPDFTSFNPYVLGFAMYSDLVRICKNPTNEDRKWFPDIAGNPDWLSVHKEAAFNYHDESFVYQFLSPKVMRDFHMFALKDDSAEPERHITAIHDDEGYKTLRATLASSYDVTNWFPRIEPLDYDVRNDRSLTIKYSIHQRKPLHSENADEVLKHIYQLWGHPVVLASFDENNDVKDILSCPRGVTSRSLDYKPQPS